MTTETMPYNDVTILLVDDDDIDFKALERALRAQKIANRVVRARDGEEGLAMLRDPQAVRRPLIVLLDINMPRMNGLEMLRELRRDPALTSTVVFVLTTSKADEDIVAAYQQHIAGYIVKGQMGEGFLRVVEMLDCYWRVVQLPAKS